MDDGLDFFNKWIDNEKTDNTVMGDLISSTFTVLTEPNENKYQQFFQFELGYFFDIDVTKYKDDTERWTVTLTYDVDSAVHYAVKMSEFYELVNVDVL